MDMTMIIRLASGALFLGVMVLLVQRRRLRILETRTGGGLSLLQLAGLKGEGPFEVREQQRLNDVVPRHAEGGKAAAGYAI